MPSYPKTMAPRGGPMRNRIEILVASVARGADGGTELDWANPASRWEVMAGYAEFRQRETDQAGRETSASNGQFWIRYRAAIAAAADNSMRVIHRGTTWDVERVEDASGARRVLMLYTRLLQEG